MSDALAVTEAETHKTGQPPGTGDRFRLIAQWVSHQAGSPAALLGSLALVMLWCASGPLFDFSEGWQLFINTSTTIVTFLMVFLIQNAQNRDTKALHLKLDELIRGVQGARTRLVNLEECSDEELNRLEAEFQRLRQRLTSDSALDGEAGLTPRRDPPRVKDLQNAPRDCAD